MGLWPGLQGNQDSCQPLSSLPRALDYKKGRFGARLTSRARRRRNFFPLTGLFLFCFVLADNQADKNPNSLCLWEPHRRICFIACTRLWRICIALQCPRTGTQNPGSWGGVTKGRGILSLRWILRLLSLFVVHATRYFVALFPQLEPEPATLQFVSSVSPSLHHRWGLAAVGRQKTERMIHNLVATASVKHVASISLRSSPGETRLKVQVLAT